LWKMIRFLQSQKSHRNLRCGRKGVDVDADVAVGVGTSVDSDTGTNKEENETSTGNNDDTSDTIDDNIVEDDDVEIVVYTIDPPSTNEADLRADTERRFDVKIPKPIRLVSLQKHAEECLSPRPFLSLVMESWGTMKLARAALLATRENDNNKDKDSDKDSEFVFCDTTGCAFTFAVVRWMSFSFPWTNTTTTTAAATATKTRILAYVHYPTISTDMMAWEWNKAKGDGDNNNNNNHHHQFQRRIKTCIKLVYYYFFSLAYGLTGSLADLVMVNSTWTYNHIHGLWRFGEHPVEIVYPPCRVPDKVDGCNDENDAQQQQQQKQQQQRENTIVSIGQFRPEKDHKLQIEALSVLLNTQPELSHTIHDRNNHEIPTDGNCNHTYNNNTPVKLLLIGSCRNDADRGRVDELRRLVKELDLGDHVDFGINPPYSELRASMLRASIGIHTMRQEHFGIGIVEMMAAGLLTIAHDSGGPRSDIVFPERNCSSSSSSSSRSGTDGGTNSSKQATGFLATTAEQYAAAMHRALTMDDPEAQAMRHRARASATRFSDAAFDQRLEQVLPLLYSN